MMSSPWQCLIVKQIRSDRKWRQEFDPASCACRVQSGLTKMLRAVKPDKRGADAWD